MFVDTALLLLLLVAIIFVSSLCRCSRRRERERILGKTSYLFSRLRPGVFASRFCRFFVFLSTTRGRNVSSSRRRFFFSTREQSVDDSGDSLQRRHDVSCVYRGSSFSSLSPSSRACTACGVFLKMILFVGQTSFMFWCIFFPLMELFILFSAKSHASSPFRHKKNYRSSSIVLSSSSSDPRRRNKNPKGFHTFSFFTFVCVEIQTHTRVLF